MTSTLLKPIDLDLALNVIARPTPYILQVGNRKGGCGKSCACVSIAEHTVREMLKALPEELHHRVQIVMVDMDPQADLTRRMGVTVKDGDETIVDVIQNSPRGLIHNVDKDLLGLAEYALKPCGWDDPIAQHIRVLPGHGDIEEILESVAGKNMAFTRLRNALHGWPDGKVNIIIIDCPPALHHLAQMAMSAANGALLLTNAEKDSVRALDAFFAHMLGMRAELDNADFDVIGVAASAVMEGTNLHSHFLGELRETYGDDLLGAIPFRIAIAEANSYAKPILDYCTKKDVRTSVHVTDPIHHIVTRILERAAA